MWIVKLGGSLMKTPYLKHCLQLLSDKYKGQVVIIPGGGVFADHVRKLQVDLKFDDEVAHHMALLAMEQYAFYCRGCAPELALIRTFEEANTSLSLNKLTCLLPQYLISNIKGLETSWSLSSDSISAIICDSFKAQGLIVVKSVDELSSSPLNRSDIQTLVDRQILDEYFPYYALKLDCPIYCLAAKGVPYCLFDII